MSRSSAFVFDASDEPAASCDLSVAIPESSSETSACAFALYSEGTPFTSAAALPLATPCAFASAPTAFELSSRAELSWHSSRPFCSSRISFDCAGSPRRRSESGSLFTRLPLPDGSSLASAAAMVGMNGDVGDICSGESSSSDASAAVAAERSGDAPSSIEGAAQRIGDGLARPNREVRRTISDEVNLPRRPRVHLAQEPPAKLAARKPAAMQEPIDLTADSDATDVDDDDASRQLALRLQREEDNARKRARDEDASLALELQRQEEATAAAASSGRAG